LRSEGVGNRPLAEIPWVKLYVDSESVIIIKVFFILSKLFVYFKCFYIIYISNVVSFTYVIFLCNLLFYFAMTGCLCHSSKLTMDLLWTCTVIKNTFWL
jgi:hypothetical protein